MSSCAFLVVRGRLVVVVVVRAVVVVVGFSRRAVVVDGVSLFNNSLMSSIPIGRSDTTFAFSRSVLFGTRPLDGRVVDDNNSSESYGN